VLVQPLAARLARGVDRLFYGDRADPSAVLARMSARLGEGIDVDEVPAAVCETVVGSLLLGSARLQLADDPAGPPTSRDDEVAVELRHRGELVGTLLVTPRAGERALHPRDHDLLVSLAGQVAPSVAALRLASQLQQSRHQLVAAREEERRRLRRELHDGVGAALAGVRLQLDAARELVDDPVAARMVDAAVAGVTAAVADVRSVTDDLRPPALDELGLVASLHLLADRVAAPALQVRVEADALPPVPAATEVAAYRIVAEALANTVRHSGASRVDVVLAAGTDGLHLRVADDGRGPGAARPGGLGLPSMRQRADELGGRCVVRPGTEGGTVVEVVLPVAPPAAPRRARSTHERDGAHGDRRRARDRRDARDARGAGSTRMTVRLLLVDDHPLFLDGVRAALTGADDLQVVGEAHDAASAVTMDGSSSPRTSC
jgi:signal transduction histidine kinase